ncbi:SPOR domain-containing protein [Pseudoalteromonas haloplanktis]|uniref:SPOR domain-containing protein n=1 Tax=Pseudoalteromonas haloplanktis TaxID=228 RepID=A0ABU1BF88_PSEHA|nr:SPOR domain-containing protein [Pseudoalteromonas haloplanktis]MDQ9093150.1 SPOR domain-containing protein [Pseudoalteromonas haloplanktis]
MNITPPLVMIKCAVFVLSGLLLFGCSSTKQTVQTNNEQYVQITKSELQQLQTSSAQWQAIKPDIERLLLIESDLNLLITQLTAIANEEPAQSNTAMTAQAQPPIQAPVAQPQRTPPALFALQIISVTQQVQLATSWQAMQHKAPSLLTGTTIANVETANVKGITYYRLKLGAYQYQKNAQADCDKLKQQQVSCIVSYYTDNPVKL